MSTIVLDGIVLNPSMRWAERYQSQGVAQAMNRTLGAVPVFFTNALIKGEPITLVADENFGWLRRSVVDQVMAIAAVVGGQYVLAFNNVAIPVVFRHQAPPADMQPIAPRTADAASDYLRGSIKLITI